MGLGKHDDFDIYFGVKSMGITGGLDVGDKREKNEDNAFLFSFFDPESLVSIPESSVLGRPRLLSVFDNVFFFFMERSPPLAAAFNSCRMQACFSTFNFP